MIDNLFTIFYEKFLLSNILGSYVVSVVLASVVVILFLYSRHDKQKNLPPGPSGLPIFGYLPFLGSEPYRKLHELRKQYGSVFGLYLGNVYVVILGDYEAVKETFSKSTTTDRPESLFTLFPDGFGFSSVNGEEWVEQRRYSMKAMRHLGLGRSSWESSMEVEIEEFLKLVSSYKGRPFDICRLLTASISNNISSLIFGRRLPLNDQSIAFLNRTVNGSQFFALVGMRSFFPQLCDFMAKWGIPPYANYYKGMIELNQFVRDQVECCKKRASNENSENFIDGYLMEIQNNEENNLGNTFNYKNLYGNIQALYIGASDTTRTSLNWLLLIMASYLDIQKKVHQEIDEVLGREDKIRWSEKTSLPFTYAVIMEGQRLYTIAPLNTSRIAMEDITIGGYEVPKGTTIIANNWGLHFDTKYWKEPDQFRPERFLSPDGKEINLKPESYNPFSYGKRNCPGETVGMIEIFYYFVALLQKFQVLPPEGETPKLQGFLGLTYQAVPQTLRFVQRK